MPPLIGGGEVVFRVNSAGRWLVDNGYGSPENDPGKLLEPGATAEVFAARDADRNGTLEKEELPSDHAKGWLVVYDLDVNGRVTPQEWDYYRAALASRNGMLAIRLGGEGDMTAKNVVWQYQRSVPQLPSPLIYQNVLYMVNDGGGRVTLLNPDNGELLLQGWASEDKKREYYGFIHDESERLSRLIENVLQLARLTRNTQRFDLRSVSVAELMGTYQGMDGPARRR